MSKFNKRFNKTMVDNFDGLSVRLNYLGGKRAESRFQTDKLRTLKKALLYSYQAETLILEDGREFRCLINADKLKNDYDNKILSIPFKDICLNTDSLGIPTSQAEENIDIQVGDVFTWKETDTHWIVYLRYLEEDAYFRAEIRKCSSIATINGKDYYVYMRGPVETTIRWNQKSNTVWNDLNYSAIIYVKADENTSKLKRFSKIKLNGINYEVKVVNKYTSGGIMILYLGETFTNNLEEINKQIEKEEILSRIKGDTIVYPYDKKEYYIDVPGGTWSLSNNKAKIIEVNDNKITIEVTTGRSGDIILRYATADVEYFLPIIIESF